jgi:hypothetical protein
VLLVFSATVSVEIPAAKGMRCVVVVWPSREMDSVSAVSMSSAVSFQSSWSMVVFRTAGLKLFVGRVYVPEPLRAMVRVLL